MLNKDDDCVNVPGTSNTSNNSQVALADSKKLDTLSSKSNPMTPEEARKLADEVIARMKEGKKPGELYDEYRPEQQLSFQHNRRNRRNIMPASQEEVTEAPTEKDDVRLATLAFFTLMALMGFMCTYLLVYVVEPMTRKEQEELMKQARAAGYDL